jgi:hypothetical protein
MKNPTDNQLHAIGADLALTPKFQSVIEAEKVRADATREACSYKNAIGVIRGSIASAEAQLAILRAAFPDLLADRALLRVKESEVIKARDAMAACLRTIEEGSLALPALERRLSEGGRAEQAERILGQYEKYSQLKPFLLAEGYSGSPTFLSCWKRLQSIAVELGPEAIADREAFVAGLKEIRPPDFWAGW